eukprot:5314800-Amphidinium_carterae.1
MLEADVHFFTQGGPAPRSEAITELERARTDMEKTYVPEVDSRAFPWLMPTGEGGLPALTGRDWQ